VDAPVETPGGVRVATVCRLKPGVMVPMPTSPFSVMIMRSVRPNAPLVLKIMLAVTEPGATLTASDLMVAPRRVAF
jgi:hypothetical protein